jgi:hypothetical protein
MSISTITGYAAYAAARIGSNGDDSTVPECLTGVSTSSRSGGSKTWCADPSAGFDSGWVSVVWTATKAGGSGSLQFQVAGCSPSTVSFAGNQTGGINSLTIRAAVTGANRRASFRNVVVQFFTNPTDTNYAEQVSLPSSQCPVASTIGQTDPVDAEVANNVVPEDSNYGKVRLAADIRFECTEPGVPSEEDLFTDTYAFT